MSVKTVDYAALRDPISNGKNFSLGRKYARVREPVSRSKGRVVGYFPSTKNCRQIAWESQLELRAVRIFEYCPSVISYWEQPGKFEIEHDYTTGRYYPDFKLELSCGGIVYVEVKPLKELQKHDVKGRYLSISNSFKDRGLDLVFVTDKHVSNMALQSNIKLIHPYSQLTISNKELAKLRSYIHTRSSIGDLVSNNISLKTIYSALSQGELITDLTRPISVSSTCIVNRGEDHENRIFTCWSASDLR